MQTNRYTLKPYLGLVLKEINFTKNKTSLLVYSEKHKDLKLLAFDSIVELEKPQQFCPTLFLFEKRKEKIIRSFIEEYASVNVDAYPIQQLEKDIPILIDKLFN